MIKPTVGRIVWYRDHQPGLDYQPCAAIVTYVHSDRLVNLSVFDCDGEHRPHTSVTLVQENDPVPNGPYCEWMPYQIGQAKKHEESSK